MSAPYWETQDVSGFKAGLLITTLERKRVVIVAVFIVIVIVAACIVPCRIVDGGKRPLCSPASLSLSIIQFAIWQTH